MRDDIVGGPRFMRGLFYALMLSAIFWMVLLLLSVSLWVMATPAASGSLISNRSNLVAWCITQD
jgi:hypothetical protein